MRIIARLNVGGPAIHVVLLTAGLRERGFETTLITGRLGDQEADMSYLAREMNVEPVYVPALQREIRLVDDFITLIALVRRIRRERPHILHTHTAKAGLIGRLAARLCGVPVIIHTFHGHVFHGYFGWVKTRLFIWLERGAALLSDAILTISEGLRQDLISYHIARPDHIRVLPLGFNLDQYLHPETLRGTLRQELNVSTDVPLIGIIGRLVPVKNHDLFLRAARQVTAQLPAAHFVIVGGGECQDTLETQAQDLGLSKVVHFMGWRKDLPAIYADLNALVISSQNEGTPVSLIEGMAAGVPVISTAVGGVPDVLQGGALGHLVPPDEPDALAQAILTAVSNPDPGCIAAARQWVVEQYGIQRLLTDTCALYLELLTQKGIVTRQ